MIKKKKSLYELLEVPQDATAAEISAAHQLLTEQYKSGERGLDGVDAAFQIKLLDVALHTLSDPIQRSAYDAEITPLAPVSMGIQTGNSPHQSQALAIRADSLSLRADALSLRADSLSLRPNTLPVSIADEGESLKEAMSSSIRSSIRVILIVIGIFIAISMVMGAIFAKREAAERAKNEEKLYLQQFYQQYGVRPANRAEAELLEAEYRRTEAENRRLENERLAAEREKNRQAEEDRRFADESRRYSEHVTAQLRQQEKEAQYQEAVRKQEEDMHERMALAEKLFKEREEAARIEREQAKWNQILMTPPHSDDK